MPALSFDRLALPQPDLQPHKHSAIASIAPADPKTRLPKQRAVSTSHPGSLSEATEFSLPRTVLPCGRETQSFPRTHGNPATMASDLEFD